MSALPAPPSTSPQPKLPLLRAVPSRHRQLAQLPFVLIVAVLLGGGMTGVLLLSTTIQAQSAELSTLQAREAELRYREAALVATVQDLRSTSNLAAQAWAMGMRPDPNPAFILMPEGTIIGTPTAVTGNELPGIVPPAPPAPAPAPEPESAPPATDGAPDEDGGTEAADGDDVEAGDAAEPGDVQSEAEQPAEDATHAEDAGEATP